VVIGAALAVAGLVFISVAAWSFLRRRAPVSSPDQKQKRSR
jgi:hypothetical protein